MPLLSRVDSGAPLLDSRSVLHVPPVAGWATLQVLRAVSAQPNLALSRGLFSEAQVSAPNTHTPAGACLGLGNAAAWPGPPVLVSLYTVGLQASSHSLLSGL